MAEVIIHEGDNFERALKVFKRKCQKAGILSDARKYRFYEKPSAAKKRKSAAAARKNAAAARKSRRANSAGR